LARHRNEDDSTCARELLMRQEGIAERQICDAVGGNTVKARS